MKKETKQLKKLIQDSKKILLITHRGPDLDAFCSMLATYKILKNMYPKKEIQMKAKQSPSIKLPLMDRIKMVEKIESEGEDLILVVDIPELRLCLEDGVDTIQNADVKVAVIDHHMTVVGASNQDILINESRSSATEQVYATFKDMFGRKFELDEDIATLIQYGIVADTNRFLYDSTSSETLRIYAEVKDFYSIDLEDFVYKSYKFPLDATPVIIEYLKSLNIKGDMAYMYISEKSIEENGFSKQGVNEAQAFLRDNYLRFVQGVHWGFIVKPTYDESSEWFVSFRSTKGYQDVEKIARKLGGGGHMYASAVRMEATSVEEVLEKVLASVEEVSAQH